jgi:hypothetical protein
LYTKWRNGDNETRIPAKGAMAMWHKSMILTESNKGGKATNKGLVE